MASKKPSFDEIAYGGRRTGWSSRYSGGYGGGSSYGYGGYGGYSSGYSYVSPYANNVKASDFEKGTITAAKTLSRDTDIEVIFGGDEIQTTRNLIQLPGIDTVTGITPADAKIVRGYTDHEIIRRRISNIEQEDIMKANKDGAHKTFACIEDVRVDKAGKTIYAGTGDNIEAAINKVTKKMLDAITDDPKLAQDIEKIGPYAVALAGRKMAGYDIDNYDKIMDKLHPIDRGLIEEIAAEAVALDDGVGSFGDIDEKIAKKGLKDSLKLAKKANELFALRAAEKDKEDEENGGAPPNSSGEKDGTDSSKTPAIGDKDEGDEELNLDMRQALTNIFKGPRTLGDPKMYLPGIRDMDSFIMPEDIIKRVANQSSSKITAARDAGLHRANEKLHQASSSLAVMKTSLERLLMSKNIESREEKRGGGKLNTNKLVLAFNGSDNVFTKRAEDIAIDSVVQLVIDLSGSMSGSKINLALQSTILMAEALAKCNVPFEIVGFRTTGRHPLAKLSSKKQAAIEELKSKGKTNRHDTIEMSYFKPFNDRYQMCLPAIGNMHSGGSNCDGESILYAAETLLKRPERKKVMLVLSDGEPAFGYSGCETSAVHAYVKQAAETIAKQGVYVVGIGIESGAVKNYYKNNIVINNVNQLPKAILEQLANAIL